MRVPGGDPGGAELAIARVMKEGVVAVASGEMPAQLNTLNGVAAEANSPEGVGKSELVLVRSELALTPFGYELEKGEFGRGALQVAAEERAARELIAASTAVSVRTQVRMVVAAALIVAGVAVVALVCSGLFRPLVLGPNDHLLLTVIQNKTGDKTLDGTEMQGLEIALRQSRTLNVLGAEAYRAGLRQVEVEGGGSTEMAPEQHVAQNVGARAYLYGEISGAHAPYSISVDVVKADSNDKVETLEETAKSREEIPAAIGRLAQDLRAQVSEDSKVEERNSVPFEQEATANVNALHAYAMGEAAMQSGQKSDALTAYQQAVSLDPKFVQAQMRLAWLYNSEKSEVGSANAAEMAQKAATKTSDKVKLLAQFCYEMNASGDYGRALKTIREFVARYPRDAGWDEGSGASAAGGGELLRRRYRRPSEVMENTLSMLRCMQRLNLS